MPKIAPSTKKINSSELNKWGIRRELPPEEITPQVVNEMKLMANYLGWVYFPYFTGIDPNAPKGWVDAYGVVICRKSRELQFFNDFKYLKLVIEKIQSTGYTFKNHVEGIEEILKSKDHQDIIFGRVFKNIVWKECIEFINNGKL